MTTAQATSSDGGIVMALYLGTKALHTEAERSGIIADVLHGRVTRAGYALLLRNLLPAYQQLERGLDRHGDAALLGELASYRFARAATIEADLAALHGADWSALPVLPSAQAYADRIKDVAGDDGARLIAHAYTRYLGDLSGGQIMQRLLARSPGLLPSQLSFYDFARWPDLAALKGDYRDALERAGAGAPDPRAVIDEAARAFTLNIDLSWAVQKALPAEAAAAD